MPLQEADIEPTEETHPILEKMEHGKFYRFTELYGMTYGQQFYVDFQENDDAKTMWLFLVKVMNLKTYLEVLVILDRLKTGRRKGELEEEVNVAGHKVPEWPCGVLREKVSKTTALSLYFDRRNLPNADGQTKSW